MFSALTDCPDCIHTAPGAGKRNFPGSPAKLNELTVESSGMPRARLVVVGVVMNWAAFVVSAAIAFFLSPFIVRSLGDAVYGIWLLVTSSAAYLGLLDLG